MKERLEQLKKDFEKEIKTTLKIEDVEQLRIAFLGKKGVVTSLMKELRDIPSEIRKEAGQLINSIKSEIETVIAKKIKNIRDEEIKNRLD
ncbi:MAG TPA: phenylalanine--tRNA ligase subunit alpha, partial [bacterium]|nr:phenylalanine--tRNA ligase subunit alpha [bacterium]